MSKSMPDGDTLSTPRMRCHDTEAIVSALMQHLNTPTQLDSTTDVTIDADAFRVLLAANKELVKALRALSPTLSFARSTLRTALLTVATKNSDWGLTKKDCDKFAGEVSAGLSKLCMRAGKDLRSNPVAKWIRKVLDMERDTDIGADANNGKDTNAEADDSKAEGETADAWCVAFCDRTKKAAFRTKDLVAAEKEYTNDIREPPEANLLDLMEAWWPDGYHHSIAGVTVEWWRERLAVLGRTKATSPGSRWSCAVDGDPETMVKVGRNKHQNKESLN